MVKIARTVFWIVLLSVGTVCFAQDDLSGTSASMKNFALPEYSKDNGRLQFILYGESARNLGSLVYLVRPKVDIMKNDVTNIRSIVSLASLEPYPLTWTAGQVADFWKDKTHSQAVIFSDSAEYDKNLRMLRGDSPVHFRSPEFSVDGVGFDADQDHKFVHVRSKVKVVIYPAARKHSGLRRVSKDNTKKEKK